MSSDLTSIQSQFKINAANSIDGTVYEFENFRLSVANLMLYRDNEAVALAPKVVETLLALIERRGEIVSKREMMKRLWADSFVEDANLTQNIYLLRKTLGKGSDERDLIETFRRRGYRFTGEIKSQANEFKENQTAKPLVEIAVESDRFDSLAVLPLANESSDEASEYLSDGITESIISRLSQLEDFRVVARNTAFRYKNRQIEPQTAARELGVNAVLTGRILQFGERLIIRTELTDAANGWQIWGEQYDCPFSDVLELQEVIAREISEKLHLKLTREEKKTLAKRDTESSEAYRLYTKGRFFLNKRLTKTIEQATEYFQRAIDADRNYALAYVGLADCFPLLSLYGALTPHEAYPKAESAARKALEIDSHLAEAYNSLGVVKLFYKWDWSGAEEAFRQAIHLNANYADAHQRYGMFLTAQSRFDEAVAEFETAKMLDPLSLITKTIAGYAFYYGREYEKAEACFKEVIAMDENYSMAHFRLGLTYAQAGKPDAALAELGKATVLSNDRDVVAAHGYVYGLQGDKEKINAALDELERRAEKGFVSNYDRAIVYAGAGDAENALEWLEKAFEEHSYWLIYLKNDPSLDKIRREPRFITLEEKIFGADDEQIIEKPSNLTQKTSENSTEFSFSRLFPWLLAGALGIFFLAWFGLNKFDSREKNAPQNLRVNNVSLKRLTPDLNVSSAAISPDGKYLVYVQRQDDKDSLWLKDIATDIAKQILPPNSDGYGVFQVSPNNEYIYFYTTRKGVPNGLVMRIPFEGGTPQEIAQNITSPVTASPDGKFIAFVRLYSLIVAGADGSNERVLKTRDRKDAWFESWGSQLSFSPDSQKIVICGGSINNGKIRRELTEIAISDGTETKIPVPVWSYLDSVQWLADGSALMVVAQETSGLPFQIWRVDYPSGAVTRVTQDFTAYRSISLSKDSKLLVTVQENGNYNLWTMPFADSRATKQITSGMTANDGFFGIATFSDGRIVYTSPRSGNWDLWMVNADGSNPEQLTANAGANVLPVVSPDGRHIFFHSDRDNSVYRIWRMDADGGNLQQMTGGEGFDMKPIVSPDGQWIYFTRTIGANSSIMKIPSTGGASVPVTVMDKVSLHAISPDGKLFAFERYDEGKPIVWQMGLMVVETGEIVRMFDDRVSQRIGFSADGKSLIYVDKKKPQNLWRIAVEGGDPQLLTNFDNDQIRTFALSANGKTLVISRGNVSHEAVLLENF